MQEKLFRQPKKISDLGFFAKSGSLDPDPQHYVVTVTQTDISKLARQRCKMQHSIKGTGLYFDQKNNTSLPPKLVETTHATFLPLFAPILHLFYPSKPTFLLSFQFLPLLN